MEIFDDDLNAEVIGFGALNVDKLYSVENIAGADEESFVKSTDTVVSIGNGNIYIHIPASVHEPDQNQNQDYLSGHNQNANQLVVYAVSLKQEYQHQEGQCNDTDHNDQ